MRVRSIRKRIQVNLENYINQHRPLTPGRFGDMLLLLPPLQNIARMMVDSVARYNQDTKQVDDLINEMLLSKFFHSSGRFSQKNERREIFEFSSPFKVH